MAGGDRASTRAAIALPLCGAINDDDGQCVGTASSDYILRLLAEGVLKLRIDSTFGLKDRGSSSPRNRKPRHDRQDPAAAAPARGALDYAIPDGTSLKESICGAVLKYTACNSAESLNLACVSRRKITLVVNEGWSNG